MPRPHLAHALGERLAAFVGEDPTDVVQMLFEQHLQAEERLDAIHHGCFAPLGKGIQPGAHGGIHLGRRRQPHRGDRGAGGRVQHIELVACAAALPLAVDEVE